MTQRWSIYEMRDEMWGSRLCSQHKFLMVVVLSFMQRNQQFAYPGDAHIAERASMSRTKATSLLQDLITYDWLQPLPLPLDLRRPGRSPRCFYLPRRELVPEVPPHCLKLSRIMNLKQPRK